nr:hypothetical protein [Tanacetum cinerariifolium]
SEETVKSGAGKDSDEDDDEDDYDDDEEEETAKDDKETKETGTGGDEESRLREEARIQEEEEAEELYRDVNINQGRGLQVTQSIEDTHVILTPVNPDDPQEREAQILPPTIPSIILENLPTFNSAFRFEERLRLLETSFNEYSQTNQVAGAVSAIPGIVHQYMDQQMKEAIGNILQ